MPNKLTLNRLKNTSFPALYRDLFTTDQLGENDIVAILSVSVFLINTNDPVLEHLGYRIIVEYCNRYNNYKPLYEITVNYGLYPISKYIEEHYVQDSEKNFYTEWNDSYTEQYKDGNIYQSKQQKELNSFFDKKEIETISVIAPTSYGKSELILKAVKEFEGKRICIITPTKALLMQTKKRIKDSHVLTGIKIILHPEMYNQSMQSCLAILTQERLLRLLKKDPSLAFDCIVVDEAHEILDDNARSQTLANDIIVAKKRNPKCVLKFLTPFISDSTNLKTRYVEYGIEEFKVTEYIKSEKYFLHDLKTEQKLYFYDQFVNEFWPISVYKDLPFEEEVVVNYSGRKNIIYCNKPVDIETFALALAQILPPIESKDIEEACANIEQYLQPQYHLIECLRKGVLYHHGSVPDAIRIYIEYLYKQIPEIKYIVTSSTLLAGVNLPAEKMFILDNKKGRSNLKADAFKNLVGRVCRFSEIFDKDNGSLRLLEPEIHIVFGRYFSSNANAKAFLSNVARVDKTVTDSVDNVLLRNTKINNENRDKLNAAEEFIENYEHDTVSDYNKRYTETEIGQSCILNGITEIDVFQNEHKMQETVENLRQKNIKIEDSNSLMKLIREEFIVLIPENEHMNLRRLLNEEACNFYAMLIDWRFSNKSYAEMIRLFVNYWANIYRNNPNAYIFVGKWGNVDREGSHSKPYVLLAGKTLTEMVNLAIVRIKEEQDFIDNILIKYIEVLNDLKLLDDTFYALVKYGTADERTICLLKNGLSLSLASLLVDKYNQYLDIDAFNSTVAYDNRLIEAMRNNQENTILIYEAQNNI